MAKIFISYSRDSQDVVEGLVQDLNDDSHETWFDQRLTGGQQWWDKILSEIRECDIFVAALTPDSLESQACQRELIYANCLQKQLLPVRLSEKVQPEALPSVLAKRQLVDYYRQDMQPSWQLVRALRELPEAPPLPDPLPDPPAVPMSYLGTLRERIETDSLLELKDQVQLVFDLRRHFRDGGPAEEIIDLLQRLKRRHELFAKVARDIDELLGAINRKLGARSGDEYILSAPRVEAHASIDTPQEDRKEKVLRQRRPLPGEVHLGAAAAPTLCPGEEFVVRFAAYTDAHRSQALRVIVQEAPSAHPRLDLETCRWRPGTKVTVRLNANYVEVSNPVQTFKWNGAWCVLRFDAKVPIDVEVNAVILRFDVAVEGLPIIAIRLEIDVSRKEEERKRTSGVSFIEQETPRSAFASYAKKDRRDVLGRVRSLQIFTGIDVFLDCLSIRPGEEWKSKLKNEIHERDIFWLFWSRSAMASEWVEWEWRTALSEKSLAEIQPHPLEPSELAPPPQELSSLQFGAAYEWYVSHLRESPITRVFRALLHKTASLMRRR